MGIVNKKHLYFDALSRTDKSLMLLSLADATVNARNKNRFKIATRDDVAIELKSSLNNIRTSINGAYGRTIGAGTYTGTREQFRRQYTPGLEFGLWKTTKNGFVLSALAEELQKQTITPKEYMSIIMFNYIQIIDDKNVSILKECVQSAFTRPNHYLKVNDIYSNNILVNQAYLTRISDKKKKEIKATCRVLFNVLSETFYFTKVSNNEIRFNGNTSNKDELISALDRTIISSSIEDILPDFTEQQFYTEYITRTTKEFVDYFSKHHLIDIPPNIISLNNSQAPIIVNDDIILEEHLGLPNIPYKPRVYTGNTYKTNFLEKNKRQSRIGKAAEKIVYEQEVERIRKINSTHTNKVIWESEINGDGAGYDIKSIEIDPNGEITDKYIEVKATSSGKHTPIEISRNEVECSRHYANEYIIYRLYDFKPSNKKFKYYTIIGDIAKIANATLEPTAFRLFYSR
ncbi:DUF3883 domain-containing protein [Rossellomorea arthrocnemi]